MIKFCPNCANKLVNDKNLSQGCKRCLKCEGVFFIVETTEPKIKDISAEDILEDFMETTKLGKKEVMQKLQIFKVELQKLQNLKNE